MFSFFKKKKEVVKDEVVAVPVPRIKTNKFVEALESIDGMNERNRPIYSQLVGDLLLTYSLDVGFGYISASESTCKEHNINISELPNLATANALLLLRDIKFNSDGKVFELLVGNDMEACTVLFPELWSQISNELGGDVLAIFPHRNNVLYTKSDSSEGKIALLEILEKFDFNDTHALSKNLYLFSNGQWSVYNS